jgi:hypothetical protein
MEHITSYCIIRDHRVTVNGEVFFESGGDLSQFLSGAYKKLQIPYAKFFKMDKLCKLAFIAAELTLREQPDRENEKKDKTALLFSNRSSSLESDRIHADSIRDTNNYFPSPSVFVYTLPNILAGEIAIRHKITGENAFFITEKFDPVLMHHYADILFRQTSTEMALCGWADVDGNRAEAFVYCLKSGKFKVRNGASAADHSAEKLSRLYRS